MPERQSILNSSGFRVQTSRNNADIRDAGFSKIGPLNKNYWLILFSSILKIFYFSRTHVGQVSTILFCPVDISFCHWRLRDTARTYIHKFIPIPKNLWLVSCIVIFQLNCWWTSYVIITWQRGRLPMQNSPLLWRELASWKQNWKQERHVMYQSWKK